MTLTLQTLMDQAARLTRTGDLKAATAAIQAALAGHAAPTPQAIDVTQMVDVAFPPIDPLVQAGAGAAIRPATVTGTAAAGQFTSGSHTAEAGTRAYKLYVPPGAGLQPLPLVVMLHGCTQSPDDFAAGTRMNDAARAQGFYVLYPAQSQQANPQRCWNWFKHNHQRRGRGEPALLAGMVRAVAQQHAIDPRRIYVAGLSAGGAMAAILGDAYPELFAAVGVHSGLATGAASSVESALRAMQMGAQTAHAVPAARVGPAAAPRGVVPPTIVFHGDRDATVNAINGEQVLAASAGSAVTGQQAQAEQGRSANGRAYTRRVFRDGSGSVQAEHWAVHGAGHAWAGGSAQGSYTDASGPDATAEMLRFFFAHPLAPAA